MSDYYVLFEGTQYEVADFAAGIAKAQELGPSAVFYVTVPISADANTFCDGVTTVFSGGAAANNKYPFGGASGVSLETTDMTIADGKYAYVFGGGYRSAVANSYLTIAGGSITNVFTGGWGNAPADVIGGTAHATVSGGTMTYLYCGGYNGGTLDASEVTVTGGSIAQVTGTHKSGAVIGSITFNLAGGTIKNAVRIGVDTSTANGVTTQNTGTIGNLILNLTGGTANNIYAGGNSINETRTGYTIINIDGINHEKKYVYGMNKAAPTEITVNMRSGNVYVLSCGGNGTEAEALVAQTPVRVRMTGGTIGYLLGGSYNYVAMKGGVDIRISDGLIANGLYGGGWRAGITDCTGNVFIDISGGTIKGSVSGGGNGTLDGNTEIRVSGDTLLTTSVNGGGNNGAVTGNTKVTVTGGTWSGTSAWIVGGGKAGAVEGSTTVTVQGADVYHIFGGGNGAAAEVHGGTKVEVTGSTVHGVLQGGGYKGNVEGLVSVSVTQSTLARDRKANYWVAGYVIGGASTATEIHGNINTTVTASTIEGGICGGSWTGTTVGNITLTLTDTTLGHMETTDEGEVLDGGDIFVVANNKADVSGSRFFGYLNNVTALGGLYQGKGGNYIEGDTVLNVFNSSFGDGIYLEYGQWDETTDPDTGEVTITEYYTTDINGNVAFNLTNVTVTGDVWGKGRYFDLASFAEGKGATLSVAGTLTATGEVAYFDSISIAARSTIAAASTTAAAITAEAASADGLYTLATGFAAQDSVITVVNAYGEVFGSVTLTEAITAGSFTAGGDTYNVGIADDVLYLGKNTAIPEPTPPPPPTATGAEVILTITDPTHDYYGATGGWKVQADQTVEWQDLTTLGAGYAYLGLGVTAAGKAMPDMYVYNAEAKYIAAYVTDDTGAISGFESIFLGEAALSQVGIADFNADGVSDLLLRTADGFVGYYAAGVFAEVQGLGTEWTVAALGDVDGNGRADVIIAHEAGYVGAYLIGSDGSISWADLGNVDATTAIVGAGDVNGDGTDDVIVQVGSDYYGAWLCGAGAVTGFFGIGTFDAAVQDIADYNADGTDDLLLRTASGVVGAALITGADTTTWAEYGALGAEWSTKGVGIL